MRYRHIRPVSEAVLDEVRMAASNLKQFLSSPAAEGIRAGFEAELIFRGLLGDGNDDDDEESEPDYDYDEAAYDIDDIVQFFSDTEPANQIERELRESYEEWSAGELEDRWENEKEEEIARWVTEHEDVIDSSPGDDDWKEKLEERVEEAIRDRDDAYESAYEEFSQDYYNFGGPEEREWLRGMDWHTMQDVGQEFGWTWPHWTNNSSESGDGEFDDLKADMLAQSFEDKFGMPTEVGNYHTVTRNDTDWIFEPDGSLNPDDLSDMPVEIVSPPMPLSSTLDILGDFFDWAKSHGAYSNSSTGFHMSVSLPNQTSEDIVRGDMPEKKIDFVKLALFLGDQYVLKQFNRESNRFCASAIDKLKSITTNNINARPAAKVIEAMKEFQNGMMGAASRALASSRGFGKYTSINPKSAYVEFRSAGNQDYFNDIAKLQNTLMRYAYALSIAGDPEAEKPEYAKKLLKLMSGVKTKQVTDPRGGRERTEVVQNFNNDAIAAFSQWMSGGISEATLKNLVKQIQRNREIAKNPPQEKIQWRVHHPNGAANITVMAASAEDAIRIAKQEYRDTTTPDSEYTAVPVLITPDEAPAARTQGGEEFVIRNRDPNDSHSGAGPVLHSFLATSNNDAIEQSRRWAAGQGRERHTVWLERFSALPPEIRATVPLRPATGTRTTIPLSNWTVWAVGNPSSTVTATGYYEDDAITDALWNPANQEWAHGHAVSDFRAIRAPNTRSSGAAAATQNITNPLHIEPGQLTMPDRYSGRSSDTGYWVAFGTEDYDTETIVSAHQSDVALGKMRAWLRDHPSRANVNYSMRPAEMSDIAWGIQQGILEYADNQIAARNLYAAQYPNASDNTPGRASRIPEVPIDVAQNFPPIETEPQNFPSHPHRSTGGEFTGQWKVVSSRTGEKLFQFGGVGNVQSDANQVAIQWARSAGITEPIEVYAIMQ